MSEEIVEEVITHAESDCTVGGCPECAPPEGSGTAPLIADEPVEETVA